MSADVGDSTETVEVPRDEFEDLVERVRDLEAAVETMSDNTASKTSVNVLLDALLGDDAVDDFTDDVAQARETANQRRETVERLASDVEDHETRLNSVEDNGKAGKVAAIAQYAAKKQNGHDVVLLSPEEIKGATGVSPRYAYDLIDDLPDEHAWLHRRKDLKQYGDLERDTDSQKRALAVDLNGVHGAAVPLNKFNNGSGGNGGE